MVRDGRQELDALNQPPRTALAAVSGLGREISSHFRTILPVWIPRHESQYHFEILGEELLIERCYLFSS